MIDFSYLAPPEQALRLRPARTSPSAADRIWRESGSRRTRLLFEKVVFEPHEERALHEIRQELKSLSAAHSASDEFLLRAYYAARCAVAESARAVARSFELRLQYGEPDAESSRLLHRGAAYVFGRDADYAPNLYIRPRLLAGASAESVTRALLQLCLPVEAFMLLPGYEERWNVLVECGPGDPPFEQSQDKAAKVVEAYTSLFPARTKRVLLLNPAQASKALKGFLARQSAELEVLPISEASQLDALIPAAEREARFGGAERDLLEFWPIRSTNRRVSDIAPAEADEDDFKSVVNDHMRFETAQSEFCNCRVS